MGSRKIKRRGLKTVKMNAASMAIVQRQIQEFVQYIQEEVLTRAHAAADPSKGALVPVRRPMVAPAVNHIKKR